MTILEAIELRHSVRKYTGDPIPENILAVLREKIDEVNHSGNLHVQLVTDEPKSFSGLMAYGSFSGVNSYLVMAGKKDDMLEERIGYYGEQLVLLAQTLGLNSCWAGASYKKIPGTYVLEDDEKIGCYIAIGFGINQGNSHKIKARGDVSNASDLTPTWFNKGIDTALLAPTAVNQQKFYFEYLGKKGDGKPKVSAKPTFSMIGYAKMDLGIAKYHFEVAAGKENFQWA
ncbi:MAG: nitroreductase [Bacteroidales bacterium]|nr:nitroreductase [Bacteroidales bacterium]